MRPGIALYETAKGELSLPDGRLWVGYAGAPGAVNASHRWREMQIGPLPPTAYRIERSIQSASMGPLVIPLVPVVPYAMAGRAGMFIHGDNSRGDRSASRGCIVLPRDARSQIAEWAGLFERAYLLVIP